MSGQVKNPQEEAEDKKNEKTRKTVWFILILITIVWLLLGLWNFCIITGQETGDFFSSIYDDMTSSC